jgi:hypothetical protein
MDSDPDQFRLGPGLSARQWKLALTRIQLLVQNYADVEIYLRHCTQRACYARATWLKNLRTYNIQYRAVW